MTHGQPRGFSEQKHRAGGWNTRSSSVRNPLVRGAWNFLSEKRSGVDRLARTIRTPLPVLDLGCGTGAYAHWFLGKKDSPVVALDWSVECLRRIPSAGRGRIMRVAADARYLPFRCRSFGSIFSIDVLGHIPRLEMALDECRRVAAPGCRLFLHSECADYRRRWPDRVLISRLGADMIAEMDGHDGLRMSVQIRAACAARFTVRRFAAPAGCFGWLMGYPEKYHRVFYAAGYRVPTFFTAVLAAMKAAPLSGAALRFINALWTRIEMRIGVSGGGSCFLDLETFTDE